MSRSNLYGILSLWYPRIVLNVVPRVDRPISTEREFPIKKREGDAYGITPTFVIMTVRYFGFGFPRNVA